MIFLLASLTLFVPVAHAATITVTTTDDENNMDGDCSLREAIIAANTDTTVDDCTAGSGTDIIDLPVGTYILAIPGKNENDAQTGDLDFNSDLTINGAGRTLTIIDADHLDRVLDISAGHTVQISGVGITGGRLTANVGGGILVDSSSTLILSNSRVTDNGAANGGGGFYINNSTLILTGSRVDHNVTPTDGGGFHVNNSTLTLTNSRVDHNDGNAGGGMIVSSSTLTLTDSRIDTNTSNYIGGGIGINGSTMTLTNSRINDNTAGYSGGGIDAGSGIMTLTNSRVYSNTVTGSGGGISLSLGTMTIIGSQVSTNTSGFAGGGISNGGALTLVNSTMSGNKAVATGGGINVVIGTTSLYNVTITNNIADSNADDDGDGGGVYITLTDGTLTATHSIIGGNVDNSPASNQHPDCSGLLTSQGYNLIEDTTGCTIGGDTTGNVTGTSPNLGPLQNNGGQTLTHALLAGSPAIDAGNPAGCLDQAGLSLTTDQRDFARPVDGDSNGSVICDMGAYEYVSLGPPAPPTDYFVYLPFIQK
jgi:CSLREA domain-containing protein